MKKITLGLVAISMLAIGTGCSEQKATQQTAQNTTVENAATGGETAKNLVGKMFSGVLPCASCPGIMTTISFNTDSTVSKQTLFQETDAMLEVENGTWSMNENIVTISYPDRKEAYLVKSDSQIAMLGEGNKEVSGELAKILHPEKNLSADRRSDSRRVHKGREEQRVFR